MGWATGVQLQAREVIIPFITVLKPALRSKTIFYRMGTEEIFCTNMVAG